MKLLISALTLAFSPVVVFAASANTVNFQGEVTAQTCSAVVNGSASNPTVLLPSVPAGELAAAGAVAGLTTFNVGLSGCQAPMTDLAIKTKFVPNGLTSSGNVLNTGTAANVGLQLLDPANVATPFVLTADGYSATGMVLAAAATSANYDFAVQYYAEAAGVTPGTVLGSVQYAISYQ